MGINERTFGAHFTLATQFCGIKCHIQNTEPTVYQFLTRSPLTRRIQSISNKLDIAFAHSGFKVLCRIIPIHYSTCILRMVIDMRYTPATHFDAYTHTSVRLVSGRFDHHLVIKTDDTSLPHLEEELKSIAKSSHLTWCQRPNNGIFLFRNNEYTFL